MTRFFPSLLVASSILAVPAQSRILFPFERHQLTREYVSSLSDDDQQLFAFEDQLSSIEANTTDKRCRYVPGDAKWPSDKAWTKLSKQLSAPNGLIATVPQASVCYGSTKDDAKCSTLTSNYYNSFTHIDDPTEVLSPLYQGLTCTPPNVFDSKACSLGGYPSYVIDAYSVLDIQVGINFARNDYVRLVIKNTGHDYSGRSTGAGALSIWTHGLGDVQVIDSFDDGAGYKGPAIKAGAGALALEIYKAASDKGLVTVLGTQQSLGAMGGYIVGGGHSPLSSLYGMAADHVLGFEVVSPMGEFLSANATTNTDLFWALRGGGGSTFGVVTSVTFKAFKDFPVSTATWTFDSTRLGLTRFWAAIKAFTDRSIENTDAGTASYYKIIPNANGKDFSFVMQPFFAPNKTAKDVNSILSPYFSKLTSFNIPFSPTITEYKGFYPAWQAAFPNEQNRGVTTILGSRLFPRSNFNSEYGRNITFNALRATAEGGHEVSVVGVAPTLARGNNADNAVNPAWRNTVLHAIARRSWATTATSSEILSVRAAFTNSTMQKWRDVTPGSGSYFNEGDRMEPNWQQSFFGSKYDKLLQIKRDWDPKQVLWAVNTVGSEGYVVESVDGMPNENGPLCKVNETTASS